MARKSLQENRFNYFLGILVVLIIASPFFPPIGTKGVFPVVFLFYTIAVVFMLSTLIEDRRKFYSLAGVYAGIFLASVILAFAESPLAGALEMAALVTFAVVLVFFLRRLFAVLFQTSRVTADSIKGGICIYILLGILWSIFYRLIYHVNPTSFIFNAQEYPNLFYFSFVTLATLGYGDIVPATRLAQTLAISEAVTGQIFLAVYIARLLGLHMAHDIMKKD
jgi:voltage-gated potassium channel Kch